MLSPLQQGVAWAALSIAFTAACLWPTLSAVAELPSPALLRYMAGIGATLLVAYAVESASAVKASRIRSPKQENWIGAIVGAAASGVVGIGISLSLAERARVGHWGWFDDLAFAFAVSSLIFLALFVVLLPLLSYEELRGALRDEEDD